MAKETKDIIGTICDEHVELNSKVNIVLNLNLNYLNLNYLNETFQLEQTKSLPFLSEHLMKKYKKDTKKQQQQNQAQNSLIKPGNESVRVNREDMNLLDKMNVVLAEWCYALNYAPSIPV